MEYIGIDVHQNESQISILTEQGERLERRIRTQRERYAEILGGRARARILIEASTGSEWVARCLEDLGHEVVVADPNFAPRNDDAAYDSLSFHAWWGGNGRGMTHAVGTTAAFPIWRPSAGRGRN